MTRCPEPVRTLMLDAETVWGPGMGNAFDPPPPPPYCYVSYQVDVPADLNPDETRQDTLEAVISAEVRESTADALVAALASPPAVWMVGGPGDKHCRTDLAQRGLLGPSQHSLVGQSAKSKLKCDGAKISIL